MVVPREGFAPPTQAFSGLCSTPELPRQKLTPKDYSTFCKVVRCHLNCHVIALQYSNSIFSQLTCGMSSNGMPILQLNSKHCVREEVHDLSFKFKQILFRQFYFLPNLNFIDLACPVKPSYLLKVIAEGPRVSIPFFDKFIYEILL